MWRVVSESRFGKAPIAWLAYRVSTVFVLIVLGLVVPTCILWLALAGDVQGALTAAVAVSAIACRCVLGLATSVALLIRTKCGALLGILVRGIQVLKDTRTVATILPDRTE